MSAALVVLAVLFIAGLPLLVDRQGASLFDSGVPAFHFAPERIPQAALEFLGGIPSGESFNFRIGKTVWSLIDLAPRFFLVSGFYLAVPLALGLGFGAYCGVIFRSRKRGTLDRFADLLLAVPDFLLILVLQILALSLAVATGLKISIGMSGSSFVLFLPCLVMGLYPFFLGFRASADESRKAQSSDYIAFARAKGLDERIIVRRHIGAGIFPRLESELPVIISMMQGSLFMTEYIFSLPGFARLLFNNAFASQPSVYMRTEYQYRLVALCLLGSVLVCSLVYATLRLALIALRGALVRE